MRSRALRHGVPVLFVAMLSVFGTVQSGTARGGAGPHRVPSAPQLLARRLTQPIPYRSLYSLAQRLKLRSSRPIPHVIRTFSPNYPVGHQDSFYVLSEDTNRFFSVRATIRVETPHLYLYVQNGEKVTTSTLKKAAHTFEYSTYPTDRSFFGSEWRPGVDDDPHITCLLGNLKSTRNGTAGFFSSEDEYPRAVNPYSNEREMFYINFANTPPGTTDFDLTLAHEFQHMIHWHMHPHEDLWLNEGMSIMAQVLNGYTDDGMANNFLAQPHTQLDSWSLSDPYANYGAAYLFLSYLYNHYGRRFIRDLVNDRAYTSFPLVDDVLRRHHIGLSARQIFDRWVIANGINDSSVAHGQYAYKALSHTVNISPAKTVPLSYTGRIPPYAADYVALDTSQNKKPVRLQFAAPTSVPVVGFSYNRSFWWGNSGDMSDPHLDRQIDLRRVRRATLHYLAWYDVEKDYDYAYVEASTDGGKTWTTLPGTTTTRSNPNGASYGNAYTGSSKGWKSQTVDLSAFSGRRIVLRFEYVTDDGYTGPGFVVRNLSIPEIGFHDNFTGWKQAGFVPVVSNAIAADWSVQIVTYTAHGSRVHRMPISAAGTGSLTIDPVRDGIKHALLVVSVAAPKTTVQSSYTLSATDQ